MTVVCLTKPPVELDVFLYTEAHRIVATGQTQACYDWFVELDQQVAYTIHGWVFEEYMLCALHPHGDFNDYNRALIWALLYWFYIESGGGMLEFRRVQ